MEQEGKIKSYICDVDCGSSEKCKFLKEFNGWFMTDDLDKIFEVLTDDIAWGMEGDETIHGIPGVQEMFRSAKSEYGEEFGLKEMVVEKILVDENNGTWYGVSTGHAAMNNGDRYAFADFVTFSPDTDNRISALNTLMVPLKA